MNTMIAILLGLNLAVLEPPRQPEPPIIRLKRTGREEQTPEQIEAERLKFTREWPKDILYPSYAISFHKPAVAKGGLDFMYEEMARHESDSREWKALWFEYRIFSCLLADYEGRFAERDKWLGEFTPGETGESGWHHTFLAPLALGKKITSKGYKLSSNEIEDLAKLMINGTRLIDYFGDRGVRKVRHPKVWAEAAAVQHYFGSMRGLAEVHAERLWKLDKKQSLSALYLCRPLISQGKPEEALKMAKASLAYAPKGMIWDLIWDDKRFAETRIAQKKRNAEEAAKAAGAKP